MGEVGLMSSEGSEQTMREKVGPKWPNNDKTITIQ